MWRIILSDGRRWDKPKDIAFRMWDKFSRKGYKVVACYCID